MQENEPATLPEEAAAAAQPEEQAAKDAKEAREEQRASRLWRDESQKALWRFITAAAVIIFYYLIQQLGAIGKFFGTILSGLSPLIWGLVLAYLLAPVAQLYEKGLLKLAKSQGWDSPKTPRRMRSVSAILMLITAILFITALLLLVIPELSNSISGIVKALPSQMESLTKQLRNKTLFDNESTIGAYLNTALLGAVQSAEDWLFDDLLGQASSLVQYFYTGVKGAVGVVYNLVIGLILSVYITIDRERLLRQIKQITFTILPGRGAQSAAELLGRGNVKLSAAIRGKLLDSSIIGCLHFVLVSFANLTPWFNYPYPVLLAVVVGVTNVVPFFGPIVGGFLTGVLVLFESPRMVIPYLIIVVALQQFDSSFLDPHIVGSRIGLRPLWSISACLLGSSIFGVPGFVLGPPLVAFVYEIGSEWSARALRKKGINGMFGISDTPEPWENNGKPVPPDGDRPSAAELIANGRVKATAFFQKFKKK